MQHSTCSAMTPLAGSQAQLGLTTAQKSALKQAHRRLFDQLLNVTAERFHVSAMLKVGCLVYSLPISALQSRLQDCF